MFVKIAMGLGNFGDEYDNTRHNAGVSLIKKLATQNSAAFAYNKYCSAYIAKINLSGKPLILAYSDSYMNLSGDCLGKILKFYKIGISECAVVYDDITLDVGRIKISAGGSAGGHNGVSDIINKCGDAFVRIRIGIGAKADKRMDLADHVLGKLSPNDANLIGSIDIDSCMRLLVSKGLEATQNLLNRKDETKVH